MKILSTLLLFSALSVAQTGVSNRTDLGAVDASGAASTKPSKSVTSLPATCGVGEQVFKSNATAGQNIYLCTSTNTWTLSSGTGGGGSVFTGSTAVTSSFSATPTFSLADVSVKSPVRFEPAAMTANVTAVTFTNKVAGAKFSIAWLEDGTGGRTVAYGASAANTCPLIPIANSTTTQQFEVAADGTTVNGTSCSATASGVVFGAEVAAPGSAPPSGDVYCWFDSTDHSGWECMANGSTNKFKMVLSGVDVTTTTGQVVATHLSSALPATQGGTSFASFTKGDLFCASGSTTLIKLGVGSDTQVLTADSTQTCGVKWAAGGGGGSTPANFVELPYGPLGSGVLGAFVANTVIYIPISTPSQGRTVNAVTVWMGSGDPAGEHLSASVFDASCTKISNGQSTTQTSGGANTTVTFTWSTPPSLTQSSSSGYGWLGISSDGGAVLFNSQAESGQVHSGDLLNGGLVTASSLLFTGVGATGTTTHVQPSTCGTRTAITGGTARVPAFAIR